MIRLVNLKCGLFFLILSGFTQNLLAQYTINGNATKDACNAYTLTQAIGSQGGSVWNNNKINLTQSFDFNFDVNLGSNDAGGDGIAFVLQPISTSVGTVGGGLGYNGIKPAVGVTIDTYPNGGFNDPAYDHIAIQLNGDLSHTSINNVAGPVQALATSNNIEDGVWHAFRMVWDAPAKKLTVYMDGVFRLSIVKDFVADVFSGNPMVFWGFTGSTGGANNHQQFRTALSPNFTFNAGQKGCVDEPITLNNSTISFTKLAKFYWNFGDGSPLESVNFNPVHVYTIPGNHDIQLRVIGADGCEATITKSIFIASKPIAGFTMSDNCVQNTIQFTDASTITGGTINNWYWDLGNGNTTTTQNASTTYATAGDKNIKLFVKSLEGCGSDTAFKTIHIFSRPVIDFTFTDSVCLGAPTNFSGIFVSGSDPVTNWAWSFNGTSVTTQNASYTFPNPGSYVVTLSASSNGSNGCLGVKTKNVFVVNKPTAYFKFNTICQFTTTTFTDSSYTTDGLTINQWWWNLGNAGISVQQNPSGIYPVSGNDTIKLVVHNAKGCVSDTLKQPIVINGKPIAGFTVSDNCVQNTIQFTDASTITGGTINKWYWDLGNGNTTTTQNASITYANPGDKNIKLFVKSLEGCGSDTAFKTIHIFSRPVIDINFTDSVCLGAPTNFSGLFVSGSDPVTKWAWNINGTPVTTQNTTYTFPNPGSYVVTLSASSNGSNGCLGVKTKNVFVVNKPTAYFKFNTICQSTTTTFTDSSYATDGLAINQWWWNLGNAGISVQQNPSGIYPVSGNDTIKLVVHNTKGCASDTLKQPVVINSKPIANFGYSKPVCNGVPVQFSDSSKVSGGVVNKWSWVYAGTAFNTTQNSNHSFTPGLQTVKLVATSSAGCVSDTLAKTFIVNPSPSVSIDFKNACKNAPVKFAALDNSGTVTQWRWVFGDGGSALTQNARHAYTANGTYKVKLYATAGNGCYSDSLAKDIIIYSTNVFAGNDTIAAAGQPVQLNATGGLSYAWTPAAPLSNANIANPVAILSTTQTFTVRAFTPEGCESFDDVTVKIYNGPDIYLPNAFTPNGDSRNDIFKGTSVGIKQFNYLRIFNRWGQLVFTTNDYNKGWDGTVRGQNQPGGIYIVIANAIDFKGNEITKRQTVMLIR